MDEGTLHVLKSTKQLFADPGTVAGAMVTGCKNVAPATKAGEYEVDVPDWGVRLATAQPVRADVCAVGIRAHYFTIESEQNRFAVRKTDEMEEPFEWIIRFRYTDQRADSPDIWWRLPKDRLSTQMPSALGVSPSDVLLLYPSHSHRT